APVKPIRNELPVYGKQADNTSATPEESFSTREIARASARLSPARRRSTRFSIFWAGAAESDVEGSILGDDIAFGQSIAGVTALDSYSRKTPDVQPPRDNTR